MSVTEHENFKVKMKEKLTTRRVLHICFCYVMYLHDYWQKYSTLDHNK